ncbi:hypothetical protein GCM10022376_26890 [Yimella lutea]
MEPLSLSLISRSVRFGPGLATAIFIVSSPGTDSASFTDFAASTAPHTVSVNAAASTFPPAAGLVNDDAVVELDEVALAAVDEVVFRDDVDDGALVLAGEEAAGCSVGCWPQPASDTTVMAATAAAAMVRMTLPLLTLRRATGDDRA